MRPPTCGSSVRKLNKGCHSGKYSVDLDANTDFNVMIHKLVVIQQTIDELKLNNKVNI